MSAEPGSPRESTCDHTASMTDAAFPDRRGATARRCRAVWSRSPVRRPRRFAGRSPRLFAADQCRSPETMIALRSRRRPPWLSKEKTGERAWLWTKRRRIFSRKWPRKAESLCTSRNPTKPVRPGRRSRSSTGAARRCCASTTCGCPPRTATSSPCGCSCRSRSRRSHRLLPRGRVGAR